VQAQPGPKDETRRGRRLGPRREAFSPAPAPLAEIRCLTIRSLGFWGILFISEQLFWATGSDPARFGGGDLSEFAPATAPPYCGNGRPANPQVGASYIMWLCAHSLRVSTERPRRRVSDP